METIAKIRRAFFVEGKSIKQICRDLRMSRNAVRKVIRSGDTEFSYDRSVQPRPKIDPWRDQLESLLEDTMLPSAENETIIPAINSFLVTTQVEGMVMYAGAAVVSATAPLFVLILFFQRQIVSGLTAGAVKG